MKQKILHAALLVTVSLGMWGCKRDEARPVVRTAAASPESRQQMLDPALPPGHPPTDPSLPAGHPPMDPHAGMPGMQGEMPSLPPPPAPSANETLAWELPSGWTESRSSGMRLATFKPSVPGKIDASVVVLGGVAGGELGNVNRWRGQVGLQPIDEAARTQMRKEVKSKAGAISLYDFTGEGADKQRMIAGLLLVNGKSWFFKMVGDPDAVAAARPGFVKVLESLRPPVDK